MQAVCFSRDAPGALVELLRRQPGVQQVRLNLSCRSVVISGHFDGHSADAFLSAAEQFTRDLLREQGNGRPQRSEGNGSTNGRRERKRDNGRRGRTVATRTNGTDRSGWFAKTAGAVRRLGHLFHGNGQVPAAPALGPAPAPRLFPPDGQNSQRRDLAPWLGCDLSGDAWHAVPAERALQCLRVNRGEGLTWEEAHERLTAIGPNLLAGIPRRSGLRIFVEQFLSLPVAMLGASALVCVATGGLADAIAILAVVFINAGIGYVTESHSERTIASLLEV